MKGISWVALAWLAAASTVALSQETVKHLGASAPSHAIVVGVPSESYDLLYSDAAYSAFRRHYRHRRPMIYASADDGMLHAFRGDFNAASERGLAQTWPLKWVRGRSADNASIGSNNEKSLGQQVWAYKPESVSSPLQKSASDRSTHAFYVGGSPVASDVQLWGAGQSADCQNATGHGDVDSQGHICGWGTVVVIPFRLRGATTAADSAGAENLHDAHMFNTVYVVLDVTDPGQPPTVVGEIVTGAQPIAATAFAVHRGRDGSRHFLLAVGSGSTDIDDDRLSVPIYDLQKLKNGLSTPVASFTADDVGSSSVAGEMVASDFDLNGSAESIYFGVASRPPSKSPSSDTHASGGGLWKIDLRRGRSDSSDPGDWHLRQIIDVDAAVTARPVLGVDTQRRPMIFFGTGRLSKDAEANTATTSDAPPAYLYGVVDKSLLVSIPDTCQRLPIDVSAMFDADAVTTKAEHAIEVAGLPGIDSIQQLRVHLITTGRDGCYAYLGWRKTLKDDGSSEGIFTEQRLIDGVLLTSMGTPSGVERLYGQDYVTGVPDPRFAPASGLAGPSVTSAADDGTKEMPNTPTPTVPCIPQGSPCLPLPSFQALDNGEISWRETNP